MNTITFSRPISRLPVAGALLLASTAMALAVPAHADTTAPCNNDSGPDGIPLNTDDGLECGTNSSADGANATAVGNNAAASGDFSVAVGDRASAAANSSTAV